jgi:hypothetical protein
MARQIAMWLTFDYALSSNGLSGNWRNSTAAALAKTEWDRLCASRVVAAPVCAGR